MQHAFDPTYIVMSRRGLGGSQLDEVKRMIAEGQTQLASDVAWVKTRRLNLQRAQAALDQAFNALIAEAR